MDRHERRDLNRALRQVAPWLDHPDLGPRSVTAGECDRCGRQPALIPGCGAGGGQFCADCILVLGDDAWCDGHVHDGEDARRWVADLPERWADLVVLWWISTGEVRPARAGSITPDGLPEPLRRALPSG